MGLPMPHTALQEQSEIAVLSFFQPLNSCPHPGPWVFRFAQHRVFGSFSLARDAGFEHFVLVLCGDDLSQDRKLGGLSSVQRSHYGVVF